MKSATQYDGLGAAPTAGTETKGTAPARIAVGGAGRLAGFIEKENDVGIESTAASAGTTRGTAVGNGQIHREADVVPAFPSGVNGIGASFSAGLLFFATLLLFVVSAGSASAATVTDRPLLFKFDAGLRTASSIAVDNSSGAVYVVEDNVDSTVGLVRQLARFHADGTPWNFGATGTNIVPGSESRFSKLAVDNSGGPTQGRIYVLEPQIATGGGLGFARMRSWDPDGSLLASVNFGSAPEDIAVSPNGEVVLLYREKQNATYLDMTATPPTQTKIVNVPASEALAVDVDAADDLYVSYFDVVRKWDDGVQGPPLASANFHRDLVVDQSSPGGHIFLAFTDRYTEILPDGTEVGTYGAQYFPSSGFITENRKIAYNPTLDRVYFLFGNPVLGANNRAHETRPMVMVFGSRQTSTVGDPTIAAPSGVGIYTAHFSGSVNPQGTSSEWHFEWKQDNQPWALASSSPPQALPVDSSSHPVEFDTSSLRGSRNFDVRLVVTNTVSELDNFSTSETFATEPQTTPPVLTIDPPSVGPSSATITGTVDPEGDTADWRAAITTDENCDFNADFDTAFPNWSGWATIAPGTSTPEPVARTFTGLLPSQKYCGKIFAINGKLKPDPFEPGNPPVPDEVSTQPVEFTTAPVAPNQLEAVGPAPRLNTSVRLNARVNPQGEDLTYHFEYSADGGSTWEVLPDQVEESESRKQIVISQEVTGLQPSSTYRFRVSVENPAGTLSEERDFTTRSTAEMQVPHRGYELVNSPNKGAQNVGPAEMASEQSPITADGNKAFWWVNAGAPGAPSGVNTIFLAERTATGWKSRAIAPHATEQIGGGSRNYDLDYVNPDFTDFVVDVATPAFFTSPEETDYLRLDSARNQTPLSHFAGDVVSVGVDATDDLEHVLLLNSIEGAQLVDIGSGNPEVVSIMPDGNPSSCGLDVAEGPFVGIEGGATRGAAMHWIPGTHMIDTADASIVYFGARPNENCSDAIGLYVRDREAGVTKLVAPADHPDGGEKQPVSFIKATDDAKHAWFLTMGRLDPADHNSTQDIYRWDMDTESRTCLTCVVPEADVSASRVVISDDFSTIYFTSEEQLISGKGILAEPNVYMLRDGQLRFVATANFEKAAITSNGDVFAFSAHFTSPDTPELTDDLVTCDIGCQQIYRYEAQENSLECVSCAGGVPNDNATRSGWKMSADGSTIAFVTRQRLVRLDVNRRSDVYEWHNGSRRLITNGVREFAVIGGAVPGVHGITPDGGTILYSAAEPSLTGYERDSLANMYAARIGGGFERPSPPIHCSEESCQGPLQAPPAEESPSSAALQGQGNVAPQRPARKCRHGKVRRRGKCVKKKQKVNRSHRRGNERNGGRGK